jgi:hypothetical protein
LLGSGEAKRSALSIAMFSTGHAGGGQGCKSDHLEPFFLAHRKHAAGKTTGATNL